MKFIVDRFLRSHIAFLLIEAIATKSEQYYSRKGFRVLRRYWMRVISNYGDSMRWYVSCLFPRRSAIDDPVLQRLTNDGYATLHDVDLALIDFVKVNHSNATTITSHNVDVVNARAFAYKLGFDAIAKKYMRVEQCNFFSRAWRLNADPVNRSKVGTLEWHRDRDGYKVLKFFIYLSDVPAGEGEHVFAVGSNRRKPFKFVPQRRYTDEEVLKEYIIKKVVGKQGMCFVEDTSCLHKGSYPGSKNRDMLVFVYFTGPIYWNEDTMDINLERVDG